MHDEPRSWAREEFGDAILGDLRLTSRLVQIGRRIAERPAGRLSEVFSNAAELQAAYNFVESPRVSVGALLRSIATATLRRSARNQVVFVPIDGTSLSLTDRAKEKDFGSIGKRDFPTRGLKILDAIAVGQDGTPLGLLDIQGWARGEKASTSRFHRRNAGQTETRRWADFVTRVSGTIRELSPRTKAWFVVDREGDSGELLRTLTKSGHRFTVRAAQNRRVLLSNGGQSRLLSVMKRSPVGGTRVVDVPGAPGRRARSATMAVRFADVVLDLLDHATGKRSPQPMRVVWAIEQRPPLGEKPIEWLLLTNAKVRSFSDANSVIDGYCYRWRIEEFHRTWKRGGCNVEQTQLRAAAHVFRWATLLATNAMRIERLKHLARNTPDSPASVEFTPIELEALRALKLKQKSRVEVLPETEPTISQAVRWIADVGGYTGKSSGGLPGSTTIGRGLERLQIWADALAYAKTLGKK
jgi:hypothetical protein